MKKTQGLIAWDFFNSSKKSWDTQRTSEFASSFWKKTRLLSYTSWVLHRSWWRKPLFSSGLSFYPIPHPLTRTSHSFPALVLHFRMVWSSGLGNHKMFFCKKDVSPSKQERKLFVWNLFESKNFPPKMVVFIWFFVLDLYFCLFHFFHASIRGSWSHGSDENRPNWSFFLNIPTKRTPVLRCPKKHCSSALVGIAGSHICKGRNKKHRNPQPRLTISHRDLPSGSAAPVLFLGWKIKLSYLGNKVEVAV